ncbi:MAG: NUDIX domain-containing protein [Sphingobacteriales bacterium]|nr:MAG: NUDIX domain-containing protein [Sphingobacteriales bacterium]
MNENNEIEVFLAHPGGPFFAKKDKGFWGIPKGLPNKNEALEEAAKREFLEETGFIPEGELTELGSVKQKGGKTVHCWALEGNLPENWELKCNNFTIEWPPKSGKLQSFPEVDKAQFFKLDEAGAYINQAQCTFLDRLALQLKGKGI